MTLGMSRYRALSYTALLGWCIAVACLANSARAQVPAPVGPDPAAAANPDRTAAANPAGLFGENGPISTTNLLKLVHSGGPLMIPIAICSFVLLVFVFERAISLRGGRVIPRPFVKRFVNQLEEGLLDRDDAERLCEENRSPVSEVFAAAVHKWGKPSVEVEQAIIDAGERVTNGLRRYLRIFSGISTISPLLGLLGTVLGMIRAFNAIATFNAMGHPELLAAGISQALLTTAAGLSVAIPAYIAYLFFVSRVDRLIIDIDSVGQRVVNVICAEGLAERKPARQKSSRSKAA